MYQQLFSSERLHRYKKSPTDTDHDIINRYLWNIELSAAFYPTLALFEVVLRNKIHDTIEASVKSNWIDENSSWFNDKTKNNIAAARKKSKTIDDLIAKLTLGFWISLFQNQYKPLIWNKKGVFDSIFPNFDIKTTDRLSIVEPKIKKIGTLRNRIFHHEPIFDDSIGINNKHDNLLLLLKWLSLDAYHLSTKLNSFNFVWEKGFVNYINKEDLIRLNAFYKHLEFPTNSQETNWLIAELNLTLNK